MLFFREFARSPTELFNSTTLVNTLFCGTPDRIWHHFNKLLPHEAFQVQQHHLTLPGNEEPELPIVVLSPRTKESSL